MKDLQKLFIKKNNKFTKLDTENYLLDQKTDFVTNLSKVYFSLGPQRLLEIQKDITQAHSDHEMNFQTKDDSGMYNEIVSTPFHGIAPIKKAYVDELVNSTAPLIKATKKLLQKLFSHSEISISSLGLQDIPQEKATELINIIKNNIYYEPALTHPSLKEYPFLSIVGFDSAVTDLKTPQNTFFEFNAGTPCGIEDQFQLYGHFQKFAPELASIASPYIPQDNSHKLLKETIDQCAKDWTSNEEGISVVLSPGSYNPAHPEIAALARRSGMPLVKIQDLYIGSDGYVRCQTNLSKNPIITGIYNRKEESFLTYSQNYSIPLRSPFTQHNKNLAKLCNKDLKEGILYSYIYDQNFNITGVEFDEEDKPKYQTLFEQISPAPGTDNPGDIIKAVWDKKLFISNLGGRVFDDKRAFRIIYEYLVPDPSCSAKPPHAISYDNLDAQFDNAVIKAPDLSGGAGIIIGAQQSTEEKKKVLDDVKMRPQYFEIQELIRLAVINTVDAKTSKYIPLPIDWRLIIFYAPDKKPQYSTHSCLVRTAPFGSLKTNTSSGGGYALGLIYDEQPNKTTTSPTKDKPLAFISKNREKDLKNFKDNLDKLIKKQDLTQIENLTYQLRDIMDLIGLNNIYWINDLRAYQQGKITLTEFIKSYEHFQKAVNST